MLPFPSEVHLFHLRYTDKQNNAIFSVVVYECETWYITLKR